MVALVTGAHVIVANAGDSRAVLIMVAKGANTTTGSSSSSSKALSSKRAAAAAVKGLGSGKTPATTSSASEEAKNNANSDGDPGGGATAGAAATAASSAAAAEAFAAALGLKMDGAGGVDSPGARTVEGEGEGGGGGGLNDSVRLDEVEDGDDFDGADEIRALLGKMMLGDGEEEEQKEGGGGGGGGGRGRVEVTAMSRDHTAANDWERERVTAAGGRAFEVNYTEEDGTEAVVRSVCVVTLHRFFCSNSNIQYVRIPYWLFRPQARRGTCSVVAGYHASTGTSIVRVINAHRGKTTKIMCTKVYV